MKYYEGHEDTYRRLEADGQSCWDRRAFDDFFMRPFLDDALAMLGPPPTAARALEIGCGTGPVSCHLAAHGYDVLGVDVSPTAIRMAQRIAAERDVQVRFEVRDVLELPGERMFDLIVDGHVWAIGLKYTKGFTQLVPSVVTVIALVASVWLLAIAARTLPIGTAYAVWVGIGAMGAAILGVVLFREPMSPARAARARRVGARMPARGATPVATSRARRSSTPGRRACRSARDPGRCTTTG